MDVGAAAELSKVKATGRARLKTPSRKAALQAVALLLLPMLCATGAAPQSEELSEYQVKAAFVYNFAKFVEWPAEAFPDRNAPLRVCVLGENPFGQELMRVVNGKKIGGHDLIVSNFLEAHLAKSCHVLFVSSSERGRIAQVIESLRGTSVLTVGETGDFVRQGGIIRFVLEEGKVRFEVNLGASDRARLKISSKLLSLARAVFTEGKG
jgi:uncharacterized protein DUF4154